MRDILLITERQGFADMTAQAKAVTWASEVGDAIDDLLGSDAAIEQYDGTITTDAHGTVQIDGTVRTGIRRKQGLTLDAWNGVAGTVQGSTPAGTIGIGFTSGLFNLESTLETELENARENLARYQDVDVNLRNFYTAEVAPSRASCWPKGCSSWSAMPRRPTATARRRVTAPASTTASNSQC